MGTGQCKINKEAKEKVKVGVNIIQKQKQNDPIPRRIEWHYLSN